MHPKALSAVPPGPDVHAAKAAADAGNPLSEFFRYHGIWSPGVRLFRVLGFRAKAMVISAMFMVPILLLAANYFRAQQGNIDFSAKERLGVAYAQSALPLLQHLLQPRPDAQRTASLVKELDKVQDKLGAELGTGPAHVAFKAALADASKRPVQPLLDLLGVATDGSNLTLDPDIDTYYIMDTALFRLPVMVDAAARIRDAAPGDLRTTTEQAMLLATNLAAVQAGIAKAAAYNPGVAPALELQAAATPVEGYLKLLDATRLRADADTKGAAQPLPAGAEQVAIDEQFKLAARSLATLDELIAARVGRMTLDRDVTLGVMLVSLLGVWYLFVSFRKVLDGGLKEVAFHIDAMRDGDLTTRPRAWGADEAARLMFTLSDMQASLRRIVGHVRGASDSIVHASSEISSASADLSGRTELSAANLEQTASAMEQIAATVRNNEATVGEATQLAATNAQAAERGGHIIGRVVQTMQDINASSGRIGDIIGTIDGIAFQTNILALNAAVEAARAGEQGRGFAVVASEVRALAQRSGAAAREIKTLINASMEAVETGARVVRDAGGAIDEIVGSSQRVRELLAQVANGAREQTTGIGQTSHSVQQLDAVTQQNAALVEQTAAAAASLKDQAVGLAGEVSRFKLPRPGAEG